ncbi:MAG TPA: 7-cyano-7-deazaguanine synthase QueC [Candidatus Gastranaerophilaceae bacterium]|nr:7-cyano-7-deazaguanine synthase QueC [Candidatus Gastranaerophilaceae bacterium]HPT41995.1 7-cyano-7-deazaguanine synthase QueC [Candidatus Gastranaerophilaceae bacterium]
MIKSIILLSGGLDSLVSLAVSKEKFNIELALTFDYGQKSAKKEIEASEKICKYYNINQKIINLDWLKEITQTSLVGDKQIPKVSRQDLASDDFVQNSAKSVWVPNRNGLFLNIAGCFADSFGYDYIIFGANKEEGQTFPDNTEEFAEIISQELQYSTLNHPKILAPLINSNKDDIVKLAIKHAVPLNLTRSCYSDKQKHCGQCESCIRLKRALEANNCQNLIKELF